MINPSRRIHRAIWPPFATTARRAIARPRSDPWFLRLVCCLDATEREKNLREHRFRYAGSQIRTRMTPRWEPPAWERLSSYGLEAPTQCCDITSARAVTAHVRYCRLITIERLCAVIDRAYRFECIDTAEFEFAGNILIPKDN